MRVTASRSKFLSIISSEYEEGSPTARRRRISSNFDLLSDPLKYMDTVNKYLDDNVNDGELDLPRGRKRTASNQLEEINE